ncbi:MAG TPA: hypothetical protein VF844_10085 [Ktedonobacteraceae bacterium]
MEVGWGRLRRPWWERLRAPGFTRRLQLDALVGADLSRPPPMYRPSAPFPLSFYPHM